jgi:hypothetical protein
MAVFASIALPITLGKHAEDGYRQVDTYPDCDPKYFAWEGTDLREMTLEERKTYYPEEFPDLDMAKELKIAEIDARTAYLIRIGFVWGGNHFSMSDAAQRNWIGLGTMASLGMMQYPCPISTVDEGVSYLTSLADLQSFLGAFAMYQLNPAAPLGAGRTLKAQVNACTTVEQVEAIVDNR